MGEIVMAAKITHVPSIWMSDMIKGYEGIRDFAIEGLTELGRRAQKLDVDIFVLCDTHWLVNQGFHLNANAHNAGDFTSPELPHMLSGLEYAYDGDTELAKLIETEARNAGLRSIAHEDHRLGLEYGTLIPMRYANKFGAKVLPIAANQFSEPDENRAFGEALVKAVQKSDKKVAFLASGSLSHCFAPNKVSANHLNTITDEFYKQVDLRVLELWKTGQIKTFLDMLPLYITKCAGEGAMADTAMLFGVLGWDKYEGKGEQLCKYFPSSGTGQVVIDFPVA